MTTTPSPIWSEEELRASAKKSSANFREERLSPTQAWAGHYKEAREKFETLFTDLNDLDPAEITSANLQGVYGKSLGEALRYLAGPPISDDDLKVIADVASLSPGVLSRSPTEVSKILDVLDKVIDPFRFPWILEGRGPTPEEKNAALLASSVLLAAQRIATERRSTGKNDQEKQVKDYLVSLGYEEIPTASISTCMLGPQANQFCAECMVGGRKADVVLRLHDLRLMAIECKVSNSATNSVKRLNNDAAAKATAWTIQFGTAGIVPAAVLSGVFKPHNLVDAQKQGLTIFWAHDLEKLGQFIESTKPQTFSR